MDGKPVNALTRWLALAVVALMLPQARPVASAGFTASEKVFPVTTRAWLSIPDPQGFRERFDRSQYGELVADPAMAAFIESCKKQISSNGQRRLEKLGLTLEDLAEVVGGEIAVAAIEPQPGRLATVLIVDTTGH